MFLFQMVGTRWCNRICFAHRRVVVTPCTLEAGGKHMPACCSCKLLLNHIFLLHDTQTAVTHVLIGLNMMTHMTELSLQDSITFLQVSICLETTLLGPNILLIITVLVDSLLCSHS